MPTMRAYLDVLDQALRGPGAVDVENVLFRIHNPLDITDVTPTPVLIAALGPLMLRLAGERTDGTITWMADERAIGEHVVPRITTAAQEAGRPAPRVIAGLPVAVCDDAAAGRERAAKVFSVYEQIPTYQRILGRGDSGRPADVVVAGTERDVEARLRSYARAGVTDLCATVFAVGDD